MRCLKKNYCEYKSHIISINIIQCQMSTAMCDYKLYIANIAYIV